MARSMIDFVLSSSRTGRKPGTGARSDITLSLCSLHRPRSNRATFTTCSAPGRSSGNDAENVKGETRSGIRHKDVNTGSPRLDRKSTRLNSSHVSISYAVFCLKKKKKKKK